MKGGRVVGVSKGWKIKEKDSRKRDRKGWFSGEENGWEDEGEKGS
jgi:hypothetical protein